jgi:tetratricopeptide (TPR) repeat protein
VKPEQPRAALSRALFVLGFAFAFVPAHTQETPAQAPTPETEKADLGPARDLVRTGAYAEADTKLAELQAQFPDDPRVLLLRGEVLVALGRPSDALPLLEKTIEIDPERPRANFQLGSVLAAAKRSDEAIAAFGREIALDGDPSVIVLARLNRSMLYQEREAWGEAARELEAVVAVEPGRREAWGDLATLYQRAGDLDAAADAIGRGRTAGFQSAPHYSSLGVAFHEKKRYDRAIALFEVALEIQPNEPLTLKNLAASLQQAGRSADAAARLQDYLRARPDAPDADEIAGRIAQLKR